MIYVIGVLIGWLSVLTYVYIKNNTKKSPEPFNNKNIGDLIRHIQGIRIESIKNYKLIRKHTSRLYSVEDRQKNSVKKLTTYIEDLSTQIDNVEADLNKVTEQVENFLTPKILTTQG